MNKKLITTLVLTSLVGSAFAMSAGAANDKQVLKDEKGAIHNVVGKLGKVSGATAEDRAFNALDKVSKDFGFDTARGNFKSKESHKDANGIAHTKVDRVIDGLRVFGQQMIVHEANGDVQGVTGDFKKLTPSAKKAELTSAQAIETAVASTGYTGELTEPATSELLFYPNGDKAVLSYLVEVTFMGDNPGRYQIAVDATNGSIIDSINRIEFGKPGGNTAPTGTNAVGTGTGVLGDTKSLNTIKSSTGSYYLVDQTKYMNATGGKIYTKTYANGTNAQTDIADADNVWTDKAAVDAHFYAGKVYDYYLANFNRNSFDNAGATMLSGVHYSRSYNNAFWNGTQMTYGDGDGVTFIPLSGDLDVDAHEITHAVTERTSNLTYSGQSGALNESWSDAQGVSVEGDNWLVGDDIYTPNTPGDGLRSMSSPSIYGDPENMSQYVNTTSDNGGVHTNSGIPNKAFYNFATAIGSRTIASKVWYTASRDYMTASTNFSGARAATLQAVGALYGTTSSYYTALQTAWSNVGVN
ncbi:M4 family metallopeptidase [Tumebacillus permanentifrigoris]|uniref:Neutral metalloproteinase n=1 Tax=Tumebacillus permanentifrigoris TaxID=378543 RepID=A0A316DFJ3_9BACL|nr:M4 family metallopeptidase [Tumebacillus permanentifrigoris]PWK16368.1 griselysin [Tumebacillus permanentifrigoris]